MSFKNITFILHKPQLSETIGACARALKNFNFNNLSIVNPKPTFPNDKIIATSVGAKDVIKKAKVYENLETSLSNLDILVATSARFRNKKIHALVIPKGKYIDLDDFSSNASPDEMVGLLKGINIVAKKLGISVDTGKGYRALANISEHGGQEVPHLHFHLFGGEPVGKMVQ